MIIVQGHHPCSCGLSTEQVPQWVWQGEAVGETPSAPPIISDLQWWRWLTLHLRHTFLSLSVKKSSTSSWKKFSKKKKKDFEVLKNVFCVWSLSCGDLSLLIYVSCHGYLFLVYILWLIWATLLSPNVLTNRAGKVTFKMQEMQEITKKFNWNKLFSSLCHIKQMSRLVVETDHFNMAVV